jgi:2-polyprenyl-3-methyl-5-hydroxy-6-metoxy-1,4-benzoquinol methylase
MALDFKGRSFDVVVAAEIISCVADQEGLIRKIAQLLRPGGRLMLSTPNPFVLRRSRVTPRDSRQVRHWLGPAELRRLLGACGLRVEHMRSIVPHGHGGILRLVNSPKLNALCSRIIAPEKIERAKEAAFLGHSIVLLGRR